MMLEQILASPVGTPFDGLHVMVTNVVRDKTKAGKDYIRIDVSDATGSTTLPIWDVDAEANALVPGTIIEIYGQRGEFNGKPRVDLKRFHIEPPGSHAISEFVPAYHVSAEDEDAFIAAVRALADPWKTLACHAFDIDVTLPFTEEGRWERFRYAPAAVKYHGNRLGGLFLHTLGMLRIINGILDSPSYAPAIGNALNADRLRFLVMVHDYAKVFEYTWELGIARREHALLDHRYMGIGWLESLNAEAGNLLPFDEMQRVQYAIACHHGQFGELQPKCVEDWLLHLADMMDSKIITVLDAPDANKDEDAE